MHRRRCLRVTASVGFAVLAGCEGLDDDDTAPTDGRPRSDESGGSSPDDGTPTPSPDPKTRTFSGTGQTETDTFSRQRPGPVAITMSHRGGGNFSIGLLDGNGERDDLLTTVVGRYSGVGLYSLADQQYRLDVEADGEWEVEIRSLPVYDSADDPAGKYGRHYRSYIGPHAFSGGERVTFSADSDGDNTVWLKNKYGERADLVFDETGRVGGASTRVNDSGVGYLDVRSNGTWSIGIE